jgi:Asp-tRNA(Asn)/Glu-tRNA(Gln) amidotransferase A subunit family amidase
VPVSLKEVLLYKDKVTYVGHVYPTNPVPTEHSYFVEILLKMGFIPFVRSNVPPSCKISDTVNRIFGSCHNPWQQGRSCGGSSGGESGLVASGCSPFGIGTDIGGSGRIPCEWTGLCGLKHGFRYTRTGNCFYGKYSAGLIVKSEVTPMTRSVDDLILFCQYMFDPANYSDVSPLKRDIYVKQAPYDPSSFQKKQKLTIGYQRNVNNQYRCSPAH